MEHENLKNKKSVFDYIVMSSTSVHIYILLFIHGFYQAFWTSFVLRLFFYFLHEMNESLMYRLCKKSKIKYTKIQKLLANVIKKNV